MRFLPESLRQKVLLGYIVGLALILGVALVNWRYMDALELMVQHGQKVSDLFETTLEIRRFEKNFFLYGKDADYESLVSFVHTAEALLDKNSGELALFTSPPVMAGLKSDVREYGAMLMGLPSDRTSVQGRVWEDRLRQKGTSIVTAAEGISKTQRRVLQEGLSSSTRSLLISVAFLMSVWFIGGAIFYRMFSRPLRMLEGHMKKVAGGEFSFIPIKSHDREIVSLNSAFNRMLQELEWRQSHLVQSEKLASLGTLLFGVAHELNNPLSNISTSCEILKEEIMEAEMDYKKELLGQIETETDRAKDIVRSLLDYSRKGKKEELNLNRTVNESIGFIRGEAPAKVSITVNVPEDITLFADKQRLQQVFLNLVKNGIDAMPGGGRITISAKTGKDGSVEIKIKDTGTGMDPEITSKIFDPFFTTKETRKGYGLGLFIAHHIVVDEHKGTIDVESNPGKGTTFLITLPAKEYDI